MNLPCLKHSQPIGLRFGLLLAFLAACPAPTSTRADTTPAAISITTTSLPPLATQQPVAITFTVAGGTSPYLWSAPLAPLPAGLSLDPATGTLSGTPATAGNSVILVRVTDANGQTKQRGWSVKIAVGVAPSALTSTTPPPPAPTPPPVSVPAPAAVLTIATTSLPPATGGVAYSQTLTATGGTAPYTWTVQGGAFPTGLNLAPQGALTGTPGTAAWLFAYPFSAYVKVADAAGATAFASLPLALLPPAGTPPPPTPTPPPATNYTITVTHGTINGATSATITAGTTLTLVADAAPAGQYFKQWSGSVAFTDAFAPTTTFTMPSADVSVTAAYATPPALVQPVSGHPRLWLNASDLPRLRSWATPTNVIYQQGERFLLNLALQVHHLCFPDGIHPAVPYPDNGDIYGYSGASVTSNMVSEEHALTLAFFALVDPDPVARVTYAQKARDLFMYVINEAAKGHLKDAPFRDPIFAIYCRSNAAGETWPLLADWLQGVTDANGNPVTILTAADRATIRDVFMMWANDCVNAYTTGGDHPSPIGVLNSHALLPGGNAARIAGNNYYLNHARLITMMPLALDAADDPALNPALPDAAPGNTLRSYLANATGAWLYQQYAMFGDPAEVRAALNLPASASVGLASGGTAVEGGLYGHSVGYLQGQLLALQTAGITDPAAIGPQAALIDSPVWDRYVHGHLSMMTPDAKVDPSQAYLGPVYQIANFGDVLRIWVTPDNVATYALLALAEQKRGDNTHLNLARWFALNAVEGGAAGLINRIQRPYDITHSLLYFLIFDPTDPLSLSPTDPRPTYATDYIDPGVGRLLARTDWSPSANLFDFRSGWLSINHQNGDAGQFQFYRQSEWLTKELSNYDNNGNGESSIWHNTLALQNWCAAGTPTVLQWFEQPYWIHGSQYNNHQAAGDPTTTAATGPDYAFAETEMTPLYNRPSPFNPSSALLDITHASRSILWLKPDLIVVYDRATSLHAGLFKRFNLTLTGLPVLDPVNHLTSIVTPKGQQFFINTLLPANATLSYVPEGGTLTNIAQLEHADGRLVVEDPSRPADVRFLHVLQAADTPAQRLIPATLVSTAGDAMSGAIVGDIAALFRVSLAGTFTGTSYHTPIHVVHHHVSGLSPGAAYSIVAAETTDGLSADIVIQPASLGAFLADAAGHLTFDLATVLP